MRRALFACVGVGLWWCLWVWRIRGRGDRSYLSAFTGSVSTTLLNKGRVPNLFLFRGRDVNSSTIRESGFTFPEGEVYVNLVDQRKRGQSKWRVKVRLAFRASGSVVRRCLYPLWWWLGKQLFIFRPGERDNQRKGNVTMNEDRCWKRTSSPYRESASRSSCSYSIEKEKERSRRACLV